VSCSCTTTCTRVLQYAGAGLFWPCHSAIDRNLFSYWYQVVLLCYYCMVQHSNTPCSQFSAVRVLAASVLGTVQHVSYDMSEVGTSACTGYLVLYLVQYRIPRCELRVLRFRDTSPSACLSKSVLCDSHRDLRNARHATTSNKVQQASSSKHRYGIYNSWMNFG
jgi:hypothetical protein